MVAHDPPTAWRSRRSDLIPMNAPDLMLDKPHVGPLDWRSEARSARAKLMVSRPSSRWFTTERRSRKAYSMGSSMVTMWQAWRALM